LNRGSPHRLLTLAVAAWAVCLRGTGLGAEPIELNDAMKGTLGPRARRDDPRALLDERAIFGDLGQSPQFVSSLKDALAALERGGVHGAIDETLRSGLAVAA
jgi:fructuronate reductase/mannitol 2-dehydrogenase